DLLPDVSQELPRRPAGLVEGIPGNAVQAVPVEAVDDRADPLRGAVGAVGDGAVTQAAPGEQHDPGMAAVDGVGPLAFHAEQFLLFVRAQRAYSNLVHGRLHVDWCWRITTWRLF